MLEIHEVTSEDAPFEILLEADPSLEKLRSYLPRSRCFVASLQAQPVGAYVIQPIAPRVYELMSIAVSPERQQGGIGTKLLRHAIATARQMKARRLELGTGTFGYQLEWYQREGFRVFAVERGFFLENYDAPIFERGIQLKDMLRLSLDYPEEDD